MDSNNMNENVNAQAEVVETEAVYDYEEPAVSDEKNPMAVVALILGICSVTICCAAPCFGFIVAIAGLIFSIIAKKKGGKKTLSTIGLITSIAGLVFGLINNIVWIILIVAPMFD